ncbi:hypothetical protein MRX96_002587 [Rhipicephalus microplus]
MGPRFRRGLLCAFVLLSIAENFNGANASHFESSKTSASSRPNTATDPCAGASRPCAVIMPEAMVDGETITEEEASAPGWIDAIRRRAKSSTTTTGKPAGARIGARRTGAVTMVAATS